MASPKNASHTPKSRPAWTETFHTYNVSFTFCIKSRLELGWHSFRHTFYKFPPIYWSLRIQDSLYLPQKLSLTKSIELNIALSSVEKSKKDVVYIVQWMDSQDPYIYLWDSVKRFQRMAKTDDINTHLLDRYFGGSVGKSLYVEYIYKKKKNQKYILQ